MPVTTKVYCETQQDPSKGCATWQKFWRLSLHGLCLGRVPPTGGAKPMNIRFLYGRPPTFPSCVNEEIRGHSQSHQKWTSQWSFLCNPMVGAFLEEWTDSCCQLQLVDLPSEYLYSLFPPPNQLTCGALAWTSTAHNRIPDICQNHHNIWLCKFLLPICKILQLERKKNCCTHSVNFYTQFCRETTFVANSRTFKCKISWPQIAVV